MNTIQSIAPSRVSPVLPCYIIVDGSFSMTTRMDDNVSRFDHAKEVLETVIDKMAKSSMLYDMVELSVILCNGNKPTVVMQPTKLCDVNTERLLADLGKPTGCTPIGQAVLEALRLADERKAALASSGAPYIQPLITLLTDGLPTDALELMLQAEEEIKHRQQEKKLCFIACGIADDNPSMIPCLQQFCEGGAAPLHIKEADNFIEYVRLLNKTVKTMQNQVVRPDFTVRPISEFPISAAM